MNSLRWKHPKDISLISLDISSSTLALLQGVGLYSVEDVCEMDDKAFWSIPNMTKPIHAEIETAVNKKLKYLMGHTEENEEKHPRPTALHVAQYFISKASYDGPNSLTHLKLQKLVYYAQGWHLALHNEPLFDEPIEAWLHGPVVQSVYKRFREYGHKRLDPRKNYLLDDKTGKLFNDPYLKAYYKNNKQFNIELEEEADPSFWKRVLDSLFNPYKK